MESLWFGATVKSAADILFCGMLLLTASAAAQTVEGTVVDGVTGSGIAPAQVFLAPVSPDPENFYNATADPLGHCRFEGVKTGSYRFGYASPGELESRGEKRRATQWIDMADHEPEDVKLQLAPPFALRGKVAMETPNGTPAPEPFPVFLMPHGRPIRSDPGKFNWMLYTDLHFEPPIPRNARGAAEARKATEGIKADELPDKLGALIATPDADGNFSLKNAYPGSYGIARAFVRRGDWTQAIFWHNQKPTGAASSSADPGGVRNDV